MNIINNLEKYGIKNLYKGTFLNYCDENYLDTDNFKAYIGINDLILTNPSSEILSTSIDSSLVTNRDDLNIDKQVSSINSLICKPLFINNSYPYCTSGDEVMVFIFDNDIKKIYYAKVTTEIPTDDKFILRRGRNVIELGKKEIRLTRERKEPLNNIGITVSDLGVEISGNFLLNGENVTDKLNDK